jgi:Ran-binding protein 1
MSETDTKLDPAVEQAKAAEPRLAKTETDLATHPVQAHESSESNDNKVGHLEHPNKYGDGGDAEKDQKESEKDATAGSSSSTTGGSGGGGVTGRVSEIALSTKDNLFSMFGGGSKEKKKEEPEDEEDDEPSGSSKAVADRAKGDGEVRHNA